MTKPVDPQSPEVQRAHFTVALRTAIRQLPRYHVRLSTGATGVPCVVYADVERAIEAVLAKAEGR